MSRERLKEAELLLKQLHEEMRAGRSDDKLADDIRDNLDDYHYHLLTPRETKALEAYSAALYLDSSATPPSEDEKLYEP